MLNRLNRGLSLSFFVNEVLWVMQGAVFPADHVYFSRVYVNCLKVLFVIVSRVYVFFKNHFRCNRYSSCRDIRDIIYLKLILFWRACSDEPSSLYTDTASQTIFVLVTRIICINMLGIVLMPLIGFPSDKPISLFVTAELYE